MPTALITGASRGLGLELARQYVAEGWTVHACCRRRGEALELVALATAARERVQVHALDVTRFEAVGGLARELRGTAFDVLVNAAGLFGPKARAEGNPGQVFGSIDYASWRELLEVNTLAPLRMAEAFVEHVATSGQRKIVTLTSSMGSIAGTGGGYYAYRTSKAALNMGMATLAKDLAPRGVVVAVVCPGWVRTDMGGPEAPLDKEDSIRGVRQVIARLTRADSGAFLRYDGQRVPW
jgi:NAD(P)-dependent dehydrogenase (short-subunit alcohol dehydrogenase family)